MRALLYETVPTFKETWIEDLGYLIRYGMAIDNNESSRGSWSGVANFWYNEASTRTPKVGRWRHHLAILVRPYTLEQLSSHVRALTCKSPFERAKGSIESLFKPIHDATSARRRPLALEVTFIRAYALHFYGQCPDLPSPIKST